MGGSLTEDELLYLYKLYPNTKQIQTFVETGTYKGNTCISLSRYFNDIYTIEIVENLYNEARQNAKEAKVNNIKFYLGDSLSVLKEIAPAYKFGAIFFIDAHQSGPDTSNNGIIHVPLLMELDIMLSSNIDKHCVFIFDDLRFFDDDAQKPWDWSHISVKNILEKFEQYGYDIIDDYSYNDKFYVII